MRRKTDNGYRWFIVTPRTVDGKLKREFDMCLGDTDEAMTYLKSHRNTKEGKELYRKFYASLDGIPKPKRKHRRLKI
jgi:hypothetical protein